MSYWLEDANEKYLGDLATNVGIIDLRDNSAGPLRELLDAGEADAELVERIIEETIGNDATAYIADMLSGAKPPVYVTDGSEDADSDQPEN